MGGMGDGEHKRNAPQPELGGVSYFTGRTWEARWPLFVGCVGGGGC